MSNSTYPTIQCGIGNRKKIAFDRISIREATNPSIGCEAVHCGYWIVTADDDEIILNDYLVEFSSDEDVIQDELDNNPEYPENSYVSFFRVVFIPRDI